MKPKIVFVGLFVTLIMASCAPMAKVAATETIVPMAENFFFVFKDYSCGTIPLDDLNTQNGILVHTPLEETESITVPFKLTDGEKNDIFQKIILIDFFNYPTNFIIPDEYMSITETPTSSYELSVTNGIETNTVHWTTGGLAESEYEKANQLWKLFRLIVSIIRNHPEYKQLPSGAMCI